MVDSDSRAQRDKERNNTVPGDTVSDDTVPIETEPNKNTLREPSDQPPGPHDGTRGGQPLVLVVSVFGRGHWLAVDLLKKGFRVQLIDVSNRLGMARPIDQEGPFGFFSSARWQGLELESLQSMGPSLEQPNGFTLWLSSGPWELRGPTSRYRAEALGQQERVLHFVEHPVVWEHDRMTWMSKLDELQFDQRWFASLASDLMANQSLHVEETYHQNRPTVLFERYHTRFSEDWNLNGGLQWVADQGVEVLKEAHVLDVVIEKGRILGLEVAAQQTLFRSCHQLVWMLNSAETAFVSPRAALKLYKGRKAEPEWVWMPYRLEFEGALELETLPHDFTIIQDLSVPWYHDNLALFRRSRNPHSYWVWLRLPGSQRFHGDYLRERIEPLLASLAAQCPRLRARCVELPLEASESSQQLGPPRFPIYSPRSDREKLGRSLNNLYFSHSERWPSYAWGAIYASQAQIIDRLSRWWGELTPQQKQKELSL